jgi:hypothetical protein
VDGRHTLAFGIERNLANPGECLFEVVLEQPNIGTCNHQCALGRVSDRLVPGITGNERSVVAECSGCDRQFDGRTQGLWRLVVEEEMMVCNVEHHGCHAILGKRSCLVRADDIHRSKRLHCREAADQCPSLEHALRAEGQRNRDHCGHRLGYCGHGKAHRCQEQRLDIVAADQAEHKDDSHEDRSRDGEDLSEAIEPSLEWRSFLFDGLDKGRYPPYLS